MGRNVRRCNATSWWRFPGVVDVEVLCASWGGREGEWRGLEGIKRGCFCDALMELPIVTWLATPSRQSRGETLGPRFSRAVSPST
jgi:hypothetical protein